MKQPTLNKFQQVLAASILLTVASARGAPVADTPIAMFAGELNTADTNSLAADGHGVPEKSGASRGLREGVNSARDRLKNARCAALFGDLSNEGFKSPVDLLDVYVSNGWIRESESDPSGTKFMNASVGASTWTPAVQLTNSSTNVRRASIIAINLNGFYYSGRIADGRYVDKVKKGGFENLYLPSVRAAVIIHELLHAVGRLPYDSPTVLNDGGKQSTTNAELVRPACF